MQAFSAKCRANLAHYGCDIAEEVRRSDGGKQQNTDDSRTCHFLEWTGHMGLQDEDPVLPDQPLQARNYLIVCYAVSLVRGETLLEKKIKHATIKKYVKAACALHRDRDLPSPYHAPIDYISMVLKAVKKFEQQKNRREPIHDEMFHYLIPRRESFHEDSLASALIDWLFLGRFVGYRSIEWCQKKQKEYEKITHKYWTGPDSYAFIYEDFQFLDACKRPIYDLATAAPTDVYYVNICFRKQKNDQNYEIIPYARDIKNPALCPVMAALCIIQRSIRLKVPPQEPLHQKGFYVPYWT